MFLVNVQCNKTTLTVFLNETLCNKTTLEDFLNETLLLCTVFWPKKSHNNQHNSSQQSTYSWKKFLLHFRIAKILFSVPNRWIDQMIDFTSLWGRRTGAGSTIQPMMKQAVYIFSYKNFWQTLHTIHEPRTVLDSRSRFVTVYRRRCE